LRKIAPLIKFDWEKGTFGPAEMYQSKGVARTYRRFNGAQSISLLRRKGRYTIRRPAMMLYRSPPQIQYNVSCFKRFRFLCDSASTSVIVITDAFLSRLLMCVSGSSETETALELIASFKIHSLEMWAPIAPTQIGATPQKAMSITWLGGGLGSDKIVGTSSLSAATPAYLRTYPPRNSQSAFWGTGAGNSNAYFSINNSVVGAILDLVMSIKLPVGGNNTTQTTLTENASVTVIYGRLDGAGGVWIADTGNVGAE